MKAGLQFIILGCGSSGGVPRIGNRWGDCDPENPKNRRRRCSALIRRTAVDGKQTNVLIDTSPDMREQLLDTNVEWLDGVVFTHEHADHTHGIDDLRMVALNGRKRIQTYASQDCAQSLMSRFAYCFESPADSYYPPILELTVIEPGRPLIIDGAGGPVALTPFDQLHGNIRSFGIKVRDLAYSSDLHDLPGESVAHLKGLNVWIVDALRRTTHVSHFSLTDALSWIERLQPTNAILTNMHVDLDYETVLDETPANVVPAYDLLAIDLGE